MNLKSALDTLQKVKKAKVGRLQDIESLRREILAAKEERLQISHMPVAREAALERLENWRASKETAALGRNLLGYFTGPSQATYDVPRVELTSELLEAAVASAAVEIITRNLDEFYADRESISDEVRQDRLDELELQISQLEDIEERMIRLAEDAGTMIMRRPDADPRSVLAFDADLP
ncbi:hypothetical protein [Devosia sp. RR2S18]|uniref:hypothetical protein n=1 Tax=Devosia rhizosphaerae TaxID=3049774 RepID=UPI00254146D8|nr:hypothetical protein [Devosia sp. RR2S18]WIJ24992.1 hypothetical protein QOV41_18585 [Devosia sp. RR2S18]